MVRSILGILGGYVAMALLVGVATAVAMRLMLGVSPSSRTKPRLTPSYLAVNLTYSAAAAFIGGIVCALIVGRSPITHAIILGVLVLAMSLWSMRVAADQQPRWYQLTLAAGMPLLIVAGGMLSAAFRSAQ